MPPSVMTQLIASMASIMGVSPPLPSLTNDENTYVYPGPTPPSTLPSWISLPPALRDGSEGRERLRRLAFNARYLSRGLAKLGFIIYGKNDSPIIPLLIFNPGKMCVFSRMMLAESPSASPSAVGRRSLNLHITQDMGQRARDRTWT